MVSSLHKAGWWLPWAPGFLVLNSWSQKRASHPRVRDKPLDGFRLLCWGHILTPGAGNWDTWSTVLPESPKVWELFPKGKVWHALTKKKEEKCWACGKKEKKVHYTGFIQHSCLSPCNWVRNPNSLHKFVNKLQSLNRRGKAQTHVGNLLCSRPSFGHFHV